MEEKIMKRNLFGKMMAVVMAMTMALPMTACGSGDAAAEGASADTSAAGEAEVSKPDAAETSADAASGGFPEVIKIGYQPVANDMMIAITEGLLDNLGYPYELVEFKSGKDMNNALASGSVDVGYIGTVPVVTGLTSELGYEVFWIDGIITECEGLVVKEGISEVGDLEGKTVGVVTGSTSHYSLMSALEDAGVAADSVTILNGAPTELIAMWERGDIDAAYIWQPSLEAMIDAGGTVIFDGNDSERVGATTAVLHVVNTEFAENYPDAVTALVDVLDSTQDVYNADPDKVAADVAKKLEMDVDMCKTSIEGYRWIPKEEQGAETYLGGDFAGVLKKTADFLAGQESITESPDEAFFAESITADFVK